MRILGCAICTFIFMTLSASVFYFYLIIGQFMKSKSYIDHLKVQSSVDDFIYKSDDSMIQKNEINSFDHYYPRETQYIDNDLKKRTTIFIRKLLDKLRRWEMRGSSVLFRKEMEMRNLYNIIWTRNTSIAYPSLKKLCNVKFSTLTKNDKPFSISMIANLFPSQTYIESIRQLIPEIKTCAIVSSSGSLTGSRKGHEIDSHDLVIRFNNAPTIGYEDDVGNKTSIRILNSQVVANSSFDISDALYSSSVIFVWDPSNYDCNLDKWYTSPDHPFFVKYIHSRLSNPKVPFYIIHPKVIWSLWDLLQESTVHKIHKRPPSSGFIGFLLAVHLCTHVFGYEYIPSIRLSDSCHYYDEFKSMGCTFGDWHPLASEKTYLFSLNSASDYDIAINGKIKISGCG